MPDHRRRGHGHDQRATARGADADPLDHLLAVTSGKPLDNLSWRLLDLLADGVAVEQLELAEGQVLEITQKMDWIYIERGHLTYTPPNNPVHSGTKELTTGDTAVSVTSTAESYWDVVKVEAGGNFKLKTTCTIHIFFKPEAHHDKRGRRVQHGSKTDNPSNPSNSRWFWLCHRSVVARRALQKDPPADGEAVLLTSKDLVEYLPALTELLAQAVADGEDHEDPRPQVCLVYLDKGNTQAQPRDAHGIHLNPVADPAQLARKVAAQKKRYDYVFVDPYDRASDRTATQIKTLTTRARVTEVSTPVIENPDYPGSTETDFAALLGYIDSIVHVARNFRIDRTTEDPDKLHFYAVVLDSRTARFESGGTRDRQQTRDADAPLRSQVDPPEGCDDAAPTTRLHLNLHRLKKAWEQSPRLAEVCDVLDEPNIPRTGDERGYWKARGFFDRWVRDLRFRRVGLALGGGGATGFAHVALLRKLREANIPIDLVSGTSFGALVGAYYCSLGLDGLDILTEQALLLTGVASLTVLTSAFFEHLVNLSIDYRPMWELPIPLYAVATNIETGQEAVFPGPVAANPSVGFAVRASGSLPGFFAPALAGNTRYVDGGAVSLVPARALLLFGADVIIGSNTFPFRKAQGDYQPTALRSLLPPPFGRLAERFLAEINPGNRMTDAARSLSLSLTSAMEKELKVASALYEHRRTDVRYWEFHRAGQVLRDALKDLATSTVIPAAIDAVRLLNTPT